MIVLTSHGRSGVMGVLFGSVAEKLARAASCPVMVVGHEAVKEALHLAAASALAAGHDVGVSSQGLD